MTELAPDCYQGGYSAKKTYQRRGSAQAPTIINIEVAHDTD